MTIETPGMMDILEQFWELKTNSMWTAYPAKVIKYKDSYATIQPLLKYAIKDKEGIRSVPNVQDVPVVRPSSKSGSINLPKLVGSYGLAIVTNRDVSGWISSSGEAIFPTETRKWDISDSFFIPGIFPELDPYKGTVDDDVLDINVVPGTKIKIGNGTSELLTILDTFFDSIKSSTGDATAVGTAATAALLTLAEIKA